MGGGTAAGRAAPLLFFLSIEVAIVAEARVVTGMVVLLAPRQEPKHLMCCDIYNKKEKKKRKRKTKREKRRVQCGKIERMVQSIDYRVAGKKMKLNESQLTTPCSKNMVAIRISIVPSKPH